MLVAPSGSQPTSGGTTTTSQVLGIYAGKAAAIDQEETIAGLEREVDHLRTRAKELEAELAEGRANDSGKVSGLDVQAAENQPAEILVSGAESMRRYWCNFIAKVFEYYIYCCSLFCFRNFVNS